MNPYNQHMVPDPSSNNIFQFQNPMILQQQFYQQPNMANFNQQYPQNGFQFGFNVMSYSNLNNNLEEEEKKKKSNHHKKSHKYHKSHKSRKSSKSKKKSLTFPYTNGNELNGIIRYLTTKTSGNICENGTIAIIASSTQPSFTSTRAPFADSLVDYTDLSSNSMWSPDNEVNSNLIFDFKTRKIKLTDYTFHTPTNRTNEYPRSWRIECSNNLSNWQIVDIREDEIVMDDNDVCHTFKCSDQKKEFFRYIKITSTEATWHNPSRYYFDISAVEFFGNLEESK